MAVVTGGAQGIGLAVVRKLAEDGARVASWDRAAEQSAATAEGALAVACDVVDYASVEAALARTTQELGQPAILVNSAGIAGPNMALADYPLEEWNRILAVNLTGTFHVNRAVVPGMIAARYGRILNIASVAGKEGNANASAYSASRPASSRSPSRWARS